MNRSSAREGPWSTPRAQRRNVKRHPELPPLAGSRRPPDRGTSGALAAHASERSLMPSVSGDPRGTHPSAQIISTSGYPASRNRNQACPRCTARMLGFVEQRLMELEAESLTGAAPGERSLGPNQSPERLSRPRLVDPPGGEIKRRRSRQHLSQRKTPFTHRVGAILLEQNDERTV